jgi:hypothetical protein
MGPTVSFRKRDRVVLSKLADLSDMPPETQAVSEAALGRTFEVKGCPYGPQRIEVGREIDSAIGGFMNTILVEPECVEPA